MRSEARVASSGTACGCRRDAHRLAARPGFLEDRFDRDRTDRGHDGDGVRIRVDDQRAARHRPPVGDLADTRHEDRLAFAGQLGADREGVPRGGRIRGDLEVDGERVARGVRSKVERRLERRVADRHGQRGVPALRGRREGAAVESEGVGVAVDDERQLQLAAHGAVLAADVQA